jgi:hypothetical protein
MNLLTMVIRVLGNADPGESSDSAMLLIIGALAVIGGTAILAGVPMVGARRRGRSVVLFLAVVWGFCAAGLGLAMLFGYAQWSRENSVLVMSGYYDASAGLGFAWHWALWGVFGAAYAGLAAGAFVGKGRRNTVGPLGLTGGESRKSAEN